MRGGHGGVRTWAIDRGIASRVPIPCTVGHEGKGLGRIEKVQVGATGSIRRSGGIGGWRRGRREGQ